MSFFSRPMQFGGTPPVVKNLIIINAIALLGTWSLQSLGYNLYDFLGLHHWSSEKFRPHQLVSHIFMHGDIMHLFFNMFMLWMFGKTLEGVWGSKRFLTFYLVCGLGAAGLQLAVNTMEINAAEREVREFQAGPDAPAFIELARTYLPYLRQIEGYTDSDIYEVERFANHYLLADDAGTDAQAVHYSDLFLRAYRNTGMVGASGAVFGLLMGFGMLFPNTVLMLLFPPIPIKAKYFVIILGVMELYMGVQNSPGDNVAHFAHLGGALFGFLMIRHWNKGRNRFY